MTAPAFAATVTMTFQNASTTSDMKVSKVSNCGTLSPTPTTVLAGKTSLPSTGNCYSTSAAAGVTYTMGSKACAFQISTIYTPPNPLLGTSGYWTPSSTATASGGATCNVVFKDISKIFTTGDYAATFSMK